MRFGILNHEEEVALAKGKEQEFKKLCVGVVKKLPPESRDVENLAMWVLESLGIVNGPAPAHPAVTILIELIRKRKEGMGITGADLTSLTQIGKTQTYYWLNRMKDAGLVGQGKQKLIEHGAVRVLSGFYLSGPNLAYTVANVKKQVDESFDGIIDTSEKLQDAMKGAEALSDEALAVAGAENMELAPVAVGGEAVEVDGSEPEAIAEPEQIIEPVPAELEPIEPKPDQKIIQQPGNTEPSQQSETSEVSE